jgi:uncharacterized protein (TIGR02996 family)
MMRWVREEISEPGQLAELLAQRRLKAARNLELRFRGAAAERADEVVKELAGSARIAQLERLGLGDNHIGDEGAAAIAVSPHLGNLRLLCLLQNTISDDGFIRIARSTTLVSLRNLTIYGNRHTDRTIRALVRGPLAAQFRELWIGGGDVTWRGARAIARSRALARLRMLALDGSSIGDAGLIEIVNSRYLRRLRELYLRSSEVTDASVAVLARSRKARRLRILNLENNDIRDVGAWELVRSPHLEQLEKLHLWDCDDLQPPVRVALKERFGDRVEVHVGDPEEELGTESVHSAGPTTGDALLDDVRRHPDDDAPRLVYGDWLADNGDPERADFIRVQCRLARCEPDDPDRATLTARQDALLKQHEWDWTSGAFLRWLQHAPSRCPIDQPHDVCTIFAEAMLLRQQEQQKGKKGATTRERSWKKLEKRLGPLNWSGEEVRLPLFCSHQFERGFIESATLDEVMFLIFAPAVRDLGMIRDLKMIYDTNDLDVGARIIQHLIATMERPRLRTLRLNTMLVEMPPLYALAAWRGLAELTALTGPSTYGEHMNADEVVRALARSRYLRKLEVLEVDTSEAYTDAAVDAVLASPYLRNLKGLRLINEDAELSNEVLERFRARFSEHHPYG